VLNNGTEVPLTVQQATTAGEINSEMPRYWVAKVVDALNEAGKPLKGSNVLALKDTSQCWAWHIPPTARGTTQAGH